MSTYRIVLEETGLPRTIATSTSENDARMIAGAVFDARQSPHRQVRVTVRAVDRVVLDLDSAKSERRPSSLHVD